MNISEYLETKNVKEKELTANFNLVKTLSIDMISHKGCPNCNDKVNQERLKAGSWSSALHCWACDSIIMIHFADRMGGTFQDHVEVYQSRDRKSYKLAYYCKEQMDGIECDVCKTVSFDPKHIADKFCPTCNVYHKA